MLFVRSGIPSSYCTRESHNNDGNRGDRGLSVMWTKRVNAMNYFETLFGFSPDGGSGVVEAIVVALACGVLIGITIRRANALLLPSAFRRHKGRP